MSTAILKNFKKSVNLLTNCQQKHELNVNHLNTTLAVQEKTDIKLTRGMKASY